ncbi:Sec20-domain-containing protein [Exidia glandulosa HHB12029]|uniref:Sec20-domain-containing protein n=1 Tax=Exidia glandulosa HHB12029 TaxID=1314781 RepID=A0A165M914_EXIGL|nr:Sec20-domain-containing protein [Exidia glandulosa HHB12029]
MAPISIELDADTRAIVDTADRRARDIGEYQIPRLRDCKGPVSLQQQLNSELRDDLDALARQIESLELAAGDVTGPPQRAIVAHVARLNALLAQHKKDARAALLASKRTIDSLSKDARSQLLQRRQPAADAQKRSDKATDDAVMEASSQVTDAFRRTMALMQSELERSVLSSQMLEQSTSTLRSTTTQHDTLTGLLSTSKTLVTALEKSDWLDRLLILAALAFFFLVVLFILKQRIVDRGLRIAFFWTRFLPSRSTNVLSQMEKGSATALAATATTLLQTMVTTAAAALATTASPAPHEAKVAEPETKGTTSLIDDIVETVVSVLDEPPVPTTDPTLRDEL